MKAKKAKRDSSGLALFLQVETEGDGGYRFGKVSASVRTVTKDGEPGWMSCYEPNSDLIGLNATSQCDLSGQDRPTADGKLYGWSVRYCDLYALELDDAEKYVVVLRHVAKHMAALADRFGNCRSFSEYVGRFADSLGITRVVSERKAEHRRNGADRFHVASLNTGLYQIDVAEAEFLAINTPKPATAAA